MKMMKKLAALLLVIVSLCAAACAEELPEVGSIVVFGSYEQDNDLTNGMEPIEWIVLDRNEETNQAFLISRLCLDNKIYYHLRVSRYWANSTLREWMNGEFFQTIFTPEEQQRVATATVDHHDPHGRRGANADTQDKLYLLSREEVLHYMPTEQDRLAWPTEYAKSKDITVDKKTGACRWWLRTPGSRECDICGVRVNGRVSAYGMQDVDWKTNTIRPVMWLHYGE